MTFAVVLIHVPEDFAVALQRSLAIDNRRVLALHHWSSEVAPKNVCLIVALAHSPVAETLSFRRTTAAPLIVLSRSSIAERAAALDAGADASLDLGDPVVLVVAQANALLRRNENPIPRSADPVVAGKLTLDPQSHRATCADKTELHISPREFDLLLFLAAHSGIVLRRDGLLAAVWGPQYVGATNTVDVHIAWLRQKLPANAGVRITTLRGVGYRFDVLD